MAKATTQKKPNGNNSALGFEATLWATAGKLRGNLEAYRADCMVALSGQIFYSTQIPEAFQKAA